MCKECLNTETNREKWISSTCSYAHIYYYILLNISELIKIRGNDSLSQEDKIFRYWSRAIKRHLTVYIYARASGAYRCTRRDRRLVLCFCRVLPSNVRGDTYLRPRQTQSHPIRLLRDIQYNGSNLRFTHRRSPHIVPDNKLHVVHLVTSREWPRQSSFERQDIHLVRGNREKGIIVTDYGGEKKSTLYRYTATTLITGEYMYSFRVWV